MEVAAGSEEDDGPASKSNKKRAVSRKTTQKNMTIVEQT
jgi:hypothetical protein